MRLSAAERKSILENIIARVGFTDKALQEYAKAVSGLRGYQALMEGFPQQQVTPSMGQPLTQQPPMSQGLPSATPPEASPSPEQLPPMGQ